MTLHLRHVLKCSLECGGGGAGWTLGTVTMSPEGAGTLARHSALSNLLHSSPVPLAAAAVLAQAGVAAMARWSGRITSLAPVLLLSRCHAVTQCHAPTSPCHQAEAELASGRQLQLASFSATFGWITRADKTSPPASSLSCGELIFDIN